MCMIYLYLWVLLCAAQDPTPSRAASISGIFMNWCPFLLAPYSTFISLRPTMPLTAPAISLTPAHAQSSKEKGNENENEKDIREMRPAHSQSESALCQLPELGEDDCDGAMSEVSFMA